MCIHTGKTVPGQKLDFTIVRRVWQAAIGFLTPNRCILCRSTDHLGNDPWLCPICISTLPQMDGGNVAPHYSFGWFNGGLRELIHHYKYENQRQLATTLASLILSRPALHQLVRQADLIVAVPMHAWKLRLKGFNPPHELAKQLARRLNKPITHSLLKKKRPTTSQTTLSRAARHANLQQTLTLGPDKLPANCRLLLIDDVMTTGATLHCCIDVLQSAYPTCKINTLTLAATQYVSI